MCSDLFDLRIGLSWNTSEDVPAKISRFSGDCLCGGNCRCRYTVFLSDVIGRDALHGNRSDVYFSDAAAPGGTIGYDNRIS